MSTPRVPLLLLGAALLGPSAAAEPRDRPKPEAEIRLPQGSSRLSDEQRIRAVQLARRAIETAELRTDERLYLISVHGFHDKTSSDVKLRVTHYRTDGDLTITHRVNLTRGLVEHADAASDRPTGLSTREFEIARDLALADERVKAALAGRKDFEVEPMVVRGGTKDAFGRGHRLVRLLFKQGRDYLSRPVVFVDLTDETVLIEQIDPDKPQ